MTLSSNTVSALRQFVRSLLDLFLSLALVVLDVALRNAGRQL